MYQFDIKGAFLNAPCNEDIYLNLPGKYRLPKGKVLKLRKYIYGLKQSAAHWHKVFALNHPTCLVSRLPVRPVYWHKR